METIQFPSYRIIVNIFRNEIQFLLVANYSVMETGLPCKCNTMLAGVSGYGCFYATDCHG